MGATIDRVPTIDVRSLGDDPRTLAVIDRACREWGFFQVVGHGISPELLDAVHARMREFFALPLDEKRAIERTATNAWGFFDRELTKNVRDWKEIFDVGPAAPGGPVGGSLPQWPSSLAAFRPTIQAYYAACERLARRLVSALAAGLGVPAQSVLRAFGPGHTSFLRLNYYPPCDDPAPADAPTMPAAGRLGVHHHTDAGALTLLLQDEHPALQVQRDGRWYLVEPRPDALVVNVGDVVQVWSNDRYRAALHRVLASRTAARYSAPFFFNPTADTRFAPLLPPGAGQRPHYRPIPWAEFRAARAAGDYADRGEEIQISHFRLDERCPPPDGKPRGQSRDVGS